MDASERIRQRDRRVSLVRRVTVWVSAGSLAMAAGIGTILGVSRHSASSSSSSSSDTGSAGGGFQQPTQAPGSSGGSGGVTSGGS